jgi:hypothetical protein
VSSSNEATLPLRPLTVGEVLDAGMALLRGNVARLLGLAAAVAVAEQAVLLPVRRAVDLTPPDYLRDIWVEPLAGMWLVLSLGMGTEAVALTLLGAAASRRAVPALLGPDAAGLPRPRAGRYLLLAVTALVAGLAAAAGWLLGVLGWLPCFMFAGLLGPALLTSLRRTERRPNSPGRLALARPWAALWHGISLAARTGLRAGGIRLLNYLAWLLVRLALGWGVIITVDQVLHLTSPFWSAALAMAAFTLANTVAYAAAGCLDAALLLEARIRSEGLDVQVRAARRRRVPVLDALAIPTPLRSGNWTHGIPPPHTVWPALPRNAWPAPPRAPYPAGQPPVQVRPAVPR